MAAQTWLVGPDRYRLRLGLPKPFFWAFEQGLESGQDISVALEFVHSGATSNNIQPRAHGELKEVVKMPDTMRPRERRAA